MERFTYEYVCAGHWEGGKGVAFKIREEILFILDGKLWCFSSGSVNVYDLPYRTSLLTESWGIYTSYRSCSGLTGQVIIATRWEPPEKIPTVRLDTYWKDRIAHVDMVDDSICVVYNRKQNQVKLTTIPGLRRWNNLDTRTFRYVNQHGEEKEGILLDVEGTTVRVVPYYDKITTAELFPGIWIAL